MITTMRTRILSLLAGLLLPAAVLANEGAEMTVQRPPLDRHDVASLQRGAKLFVNYCMGCHGAQHMRFNRMVDDLRLSDKQITDNLIFRGTVAKDGTYVTDKIGDTMRTAMDRADAKDAFGVVPPDLSVEARVRGTEWLYAYLRGYYRDEKSATGWNNLVFPNVAMPNVLWELSGQNKLTTKEFPTIEQAKGEFVQVHRVGSLETVHPPEGSADHAVKYVLRVVEPDKPGSMSSQDFDTAVIDIVNYLDYIAEPAKEERIKVGIKVLIFLAILFVFAYWTKREYWRDVH